ncbi:putative transcriptional regulator, BolA superfamily [Methylophaga frappieri]|jgi:acid stress-induced BolA-like protein IbaG/YrbA|uniref:Putative transcriptional regulator, BolA superfamily n=1 Tax=Methylophaga frappieri (strain ATCC BAA-2434 / DSM 25690 / JAM7) TaxID=754477 RepID=I1YIP6_METFJ|nr:BolA/IbaG family iron-sulfur metabolism protein [Methylophaga frappieri]AFJ02789.1 putative transcriptional regulator, BolA superfamily [Methylophaga frappieri]
MKASEIKQLIEAGLPDADVVVIGEDGEHFDAVVICPAFAGKSLIEQHRMVKATLGDKFTSGELHALSLKTRAEK